MQPLEGFAYPSSLPRWGTGVPTETSHATQSTHPTPQEVKKESIYTRKQDLQISGGRCFISYKNHIKQTFSILHVIYNDTTPVDFILIVF